LLRRLVLQCVRQAGAFLPANPTPQMQQTESCALTVRASCSTSKSG
jgi:hypothetical protein